MEDIDREARLSAAYTTRLDQTLQDLQERVKEQEALLEKLRATTSIPITDGPSPDPKTHLRQLLALKHAYDTLSTTPPHLPPPKSALPALLAYRTTSTCIQETQQSLTSTSHDLTQTHAALQSEQSAHREALAIQTSLQARIQSLTTAHHHQTHQTPTQLTTSLKHSLQTTKSHYDTQTLHLVHAFNKFITAHLATPLAAEELGGPIVGQLQSLTPQNLIAGFSTQGKPKIPRANANVHSTPNHTHRQRRIDEIWGPAPSPSETGDDTPDGPASASAPRPAPTPWDESHAAATELRALTEQLLNALLDAEGDGTGGGGDANGYVTLARDSAAARFLVRSKVAQYHFRDARRLKLLDFGADIV
ncbi:hypothetical protein MFRU_005g04650 [Monilinia fructicola]|nr:hypothetical protein MFRU_005g04650 [Monilinia fructicola]